MPPASKPNNIQLPLAVGQRWRDVDPRHKEPRVFEIISIDDRNKSVRIRTLGHLGPHGGNLRCTDAKFSRFNGKRGGYEYRAEDQK